MTWVIPSDWDYSTNWRLFDLTGIIMLTNIGFLKIWLSGIIMIWDYFMKIKMFDQNVQVQPQHVGGFFS